MAIYLDDRGHGEGLVMMSLTDWQMIYRLLATSVNDPLDQLVIDPSARDALGCLVQKKE